jgi:hypothetical protein
VILQLPTLSFLAQSQINVLINFPPKKPNHRTPIVRRDPIASGVQPLDFYRSPELLSIANLMDFHYDRIKDNLEQVVMHLQGFNKLLYINAQVINVNIVIKQNPDGTICTGACLCLERKKISLEFHKC